MIHVESKAMKHLCIQTTASNNTSVSIEY